MNRIIKKWLVNTNGFDKRKIENCWRFNTIKIKKDYIYREEVYLIKEEYLNENKVDFYLNRNPNKIRINKEVYEILLVLSHKSIEITTTGALLSNYPNISFDELFNDDTKTFKDKFKSIYIVSAKKIMPVVIVEFSNESEVKKFTLPDWFGTEITNKKN